MVKALNAKADRAELEERVELLKTAGNFTTLFYTLYYIYMTYMYPPPHIKTAGNITTLYYTLYYI